MQHQSTPDPLEVASGRDRLEDGVRDVLAQHGRLTTPIDDLGSTDSLVAAGLTSHASVTVMLALEDAFDVEFTPELLTKATFANIDSACAALRQLGADETGS